MEFSGEDIIAYEEIILDESILDLDAWLPEKAIEEILQAILYRDDLYKLYCLGNNNISLI